MSFISFPKVGEALPKKCLVAAILLSLSGASMASVATDEANAEADASSARNPSKDSTELESVRVEGSQVKNSSKYTETLLDTPQSITIVPSKVIKEQNLLSLRDILSTLPGITFGAGEGGGGYGDSINLRGFAGSNDVTIDGVRDSAQYTRSDPFNLEQVELVNGANSVYSGAGSVGGTINLVSKAAHEGDARSVSAGIGSDNYMRATADINQMVGEHTAVRLNLMAHENDVPGRDYEKMERWGFAPSIAFGLGTDTRVALSYLHQKDDNTPQYGVPFFNGRPLDGVDPSNYYGYRNIDQQKVDVDSFTATIDHEFEDNLSLRNLSRVQRVEQLSVVDAVQGIWCMPNNLTPTGSACTSGTGATQIDVPVGSYLPSGPRGLVRDTTNKTLYNQTDFTTSFNTGVVNHTLVAGFSFAHETYTLDTSNLFRNPDGTNPFVAPEHLPFMDIYNPDSRYTGPINKTLSGRTDGELDNRALYAFDTLKFTDQWMLNLGARYERNEGSSTIYTISSTGSNIGQITGANAPAKNADNLFSYRAGLIFKPVEQASIYFAYANSKTPSKASVNGSCTAAPATASNCNVDPESAVNYELGAKWDVMDGHLSLTGSIFRNERENYRVTDPNNPLNPSGEQVLDGNARVDGITLGVSGTITDQWSIFANYTHLDSKVIQGASDFVSSLGQDYTKGDPLVNTPENALSVWTTYDITRQWQVGYGATYQADNTVQQHSATYVSGPPAKSPDYWVHRAMAAYRVNRDFTLQFNVNNLTDKEYYTRIRNNGWATPGDARSYTLSATYNF